MSEAAVTEVNPKIWQSVYYLTDCYSMCIRTLNHCINKGGKYTEGAHTKLLQECAVLCGTTADFIIQHFDNHERVYERCANICEQTANVCEYFWDDAQLKDCADICRKCADYCIKMK